MNSQPASPKKWEITEAAFSRFLAWLNPNEEKAGEKYEEIRRNLIKIFVCRGCTCPEELSDETIDRVLRRIEEIGDTYVGDPALYCFGVAHKVHLEYVRKKPRPRPPAPESSLRPEAEYDCLEKCMERITARSRDLILEYYTEEEQSIIKIRKKLAEKLGIPLNSLRIRACRIRATLETCVAECLREKAAG